MAIVAVVGGVGSGEVAAWASHFHTQCHHRYIESQTEEAKDGSGSSRWCENRMPSAAASPLSAPPTTGPALFGLGFGSNSSGGSGVCENGTPPATVTALRSAHPPTRLPTHPVPPLATHGKLSPCQVGFVQLFCSDLVAVSCQK